MKRDSRGKLLINYNLLVCAAGGGDVKCRDEYLGKDFFETGDPKPNH